MAKTLKDQLSTLTAKVNSQTHQVVDIIDSKLISLNDTLSVSMSQVSSKLEKINSHDHRLSLVENQLKAFFPSASVLSHDALVEPISNFKAASHLPFFL